MSTLIGLVLAALLVAGVVHAGERIDAGITARISQVNTDLNCAYPSAAGSCPGNPFAIPGG